MGPVLQYRGAARARTGRMLLGMVEARHAISIMHGSPFVGLIDHLAELRATLLLSGECCTCSGT
jgi:hypothetical protein